jgi:hypothetical protein
MFCQKFRNKVTGEEINSDPRLLPEELVARGIRLQTIKLVSVSLIYYINVLNSNNSYYEYRKHLFCHLNCNLTILPYIFASITVSPPDYYFCNSALKYMIQVFFVSTKIAFQFLTRLLCFIINCSCVMMAQSLVSASVAIGSYSECLLFSMGYYS